MIRFYDTNALWRLDEILSDRIAERLRTPRVLAHHQPLQFLVNAAKVFDRIVLATT